ncbi:MAG: protein phosphatase CheZ [Deltaproteobacteria bacterium]|nr:protein phosphatase CheZ [Deltaproteobacteria bacterium]
MNASSGLREISREEILRALQEIGELLESYSVLMENLSETGDVDQGSENTLVKHKEKISGQENVLKDLELLEKFLAFILHRIKSHRLTFRLPYKGKQVEIEENTELSELSDHLSQFQPVLEKTVSEVLALTEGREAFQSPRIRMLLVSLASMYKAVIRQDWSDVELCLNHINMITTSKESKELVDHIGDIVRKIHDSFKELSMDYPIDDLTHTTDEIPDAVQNLYRVIRELEESANTNLDMLERLNNQAEFDVGQAKEAIEVLSICSDELKTLMKANPDIAKELAEVRVSLAEGALVSLKDFQGVMEEFQGTYLSLLSNQSYQDLTGQTMKKVIAFMESLQYQLIQIISKEAKPEASVEEKKRDTSGEFGPDAKNRLSQGRVDDLLADLGF